ncbi:MAG: sulfatase-like hydrolase/transferase [Planctomycetales bacterium]|nr:sulfatase-like hydrolase/transferase [Planctomycetales bacterium]
MIIKPQLPLLCLLAIGLAAAKTPCDAADAPNILMIMVDDLGYGDLSSYGAKDLRSPNIDALALKGLVFSNFYANCPVCSPSRASLMTGRYPELVGVPGVIRTHAENSWGDLADDAVLLPAMLKQAGYHTAIVGKWHLGLERPDRPHDRGFDLFHGFLGDMMDDYYHHRRHNNNYMRKNDEVLEPEGHATDLFTQWSCDYIQQQVGAKRPFFLYLAYNAPHTPIQPPQSWLDKVLKREPGITERRAKLVALIEHLDDGIGQVLRKLEETGLAKNTLILFTSDNGGQIEVGANNGELRDGKQSMYEGGIKVPACAVWPGVIASGRLTPDRCVTMDLYPTICEAAGVQVEHEIDGVSLLPLLQGGDGPATRDLFFHRREGGDRYGGLTINAMRRGDWKLLQNSPFAPLELYNLSEDPLEKKDLASSNRGKFRELSAALRVQVQRGGAIPWQPRSRVSAKP